MATTAYDPFSFKLPGQYEYDGIVFSVVYPDINYAMLDTWKVKPTDVVIATHPKAGKYFSISILMISMVQSKVPPGWEPS